MTRTLSQKGIEKAAAKIYDKGITAATVGNCQVIAGIAIAAYLDEVEREAPAPAGWRGMVEQTDEEFIAEIAALAEKATGLPDLPWEARNGDVYFDGERVAKDCWTADAAFIAASRSAIPRLLGIIERLEKRAKKAEADAASYKAEAAEMSNPERDVYAQQILRIGTERDAALAKVERLTEALEFIKDNNVRWAQETAAAALKAEELTWT